jgi:ATP-dependent DNA helicase RecG
MTSVNPLDRLNELLHQPSETQWLEFKEAKNNYSFEKLGKYFSALSNEAALGVLTEGWLVFGINRNHEVVGTQYRPKRSDLDNLKKEIADKTNNRLSFRDIHEVHHPHGRVLMFEIPAALPGIPTAWEGHFYGREGESLAPLSLDEQDRLRNRTEPDWSALIEEEAAIGDLEPAAIAVARKKFKEKYPSQAGQVDEWSDIIFLNKAKVTIGGRITHTAILLLGKAESAHFLSPAQAQMTWILKDEQGVEKDYKHFGPPFFLRTEDLFAQIRNLTYRYMPEGTLFPIEVPQYDAWVMRELLHNCIAHQDYKLNGRINVLEQQDSLLFTNLGHFIPPSVEWVIETDSPPDQYRNPFLAQAMVNLNMIDTMGSGMKRIFRVQRDRFFPLPDYDLNDPIRVKVRLFGMILDENYTRLLMQNTGLELRKVISLDKVQKKRPLTDSEFKLLKKDHLVEGRRPSLYVAASVAKVTGDRATYIKNRPFDKAYYKRLLLEYLGRFGEVSPSEIEKLLLDKLPEILEEKQKKNKIRNLLQEMAWKDSTILNKGGRGPNARWILKN